MTNNLVEIFFEAAWKFPTNKAIIHRDLKISYEGMSQKVSNTASYLQSKGIKKGTKVLVFVPMSIKLYQTVLALFSLGAVVVFVDEWADRKRLRKALQVVEVDAIIAPKKLLWLAYLLPPFNTIRTKISIPNRLKPSLHNIQQVDPHDTALITFTTGSTGLPKAANRTHHFLAEQFRILKKEIAAKDSDVCLVTLPIVLLSILGTGATGIIADYNQKKPEKLNAQAQLDLVKSQKVNLLISSPYFVEKLSEVVNEELPQLRKILTGGAPVFPSLAEKIQGAFPNSVNMVAYGSTEAEPISTVSMKKVIADDNLSQFGLLVGAIHPEIELKVIKICEDSISLNEEGWNNWELLEGELGEIVVAGPHVLTSYFNSEEAFNLNKIRDGEKIWHRTGDSGRYINGKIYLNGRTSQLIPSEDGLQSLFIIEYQLGKISDVTIGTLINDTIVLETETHSTDAIIQDKVRELAIPHERVICLRSIPRDPRHFSKIDYKALHSKIS